MIFIPGPVEFLMGSPVTEAGYFNKNQHKQRIGRSFSISSKPVTLEQYRQFADWQKASDYSSGSVECPVVYVTWHNSAAYCNWLSEREGIPKDHWCYELNENYEVTKLKANYLSLTGYRLPTEAELEYATRAESRTSRYFGETEELLSYYAWYDHNSERKLQAVGRLKPNDFGCFDAHGSVWNWCLNYNENSTVDHQDGKIIEDAENRLIVIHTDRRAFRGGSVCDGALFCRSFIRNSGRPEEVSTKSSVFALRGLYDQIFLLFSPKVGKNE